MRKKEQMCESETINGSVQRRRCMTCLQLFCDTWAVVTTLAGGVNGAAIAFVDGVGSQAGFTYPTSVAVDLNLNIIVADPYNKCIRMVTPAAAVTTIAGRVGSNGFADGFGTNAFFRFFTGVGVDSSGCFLVADSENNRIRQVTPAGVVTTLVGSGSYDFADGLGTNAAFRYPQGVGVDSSGNIFVADAGNQRLRKLTPAAGALTGVSRCSEAESFICVSMYHASAHEYISQSVFLPFLPCYHWWLLNLSLCVRCFPT